MDDLQLARDLRAAADYLRTYGWMQGGFGFHGGERCMGGAIASAVGKNPSLLLIEMAFDPYGIALDLMQGGFNAIGKWNDEPGRTLNEVLDRLESTALALEVRALSHETAPEPREVVAVA